MLVIGCSVTRTPKTREKRQQLSERASEGDDVVTVTVRDKGKLQGRALAITAQSSVKLTPSEVALVFNFLTVPLMGANA